MKTKKTTKVETKKPETNKVGLVDAIDSTTDIAPHKFVDRLKILFGHRQTVMTRVQVTVQIPKDGPTKFGYEFLGTKVYVWKPKAPKRVEAQGPTP